MLSLERRCALRCLQEPLLELGMCALPMGCRCTKLLEVGAGGLRRRDGRRALDLLREPLLELAVGGLPGESSGAKLFDRRVPRSDLGFECRRALCLLRE